MKELNHIRADFFSYFEKNNHHKLASSSLIPHNDSSLMFTNAGMVQFKSIFTGVENPSYGRVVTAQKCVRAGGKHNDLDNVGYTARHHTFFEMLGNFSFGDYFKEEAIYYAWHFLTENLCLPKDRLLVTVFHEDEEARMLWRKIADLPDKRIISIKTQDNFWSMGDTGPCGPCSEIFYDHGEGVFGGPPGSADEDGDRFVEIWNLVFMQYNQLKSGERVPLPKACIDTGAGIERLAAVLQNVHNNFEIDLFKNIIAFIEEKLALKSSPENIVSFRVIADHLRSIGFLIADGVLPSNEGRGYVLRRIMRRAMRHAHLLGREQPVIWQLVPVLLQQMGEAYGELISEKDLILNVVKEEEEKFSQTLYRGLEILNKELNQLPLGKKLDGEVAFKLYDTYGFPLDLTQDIARNHGCEVDLQSFEFAMAQQQERARKSWVGSGEVEMSEIWLSLAQKFKASSFIGYDNTEAKVKILSIIKENQACDSVQEGDIAYLLLDQTIFYAESGGQLADRGLLLGAYSEAEILDVQKKVNNLYIHKVKILRGVMRVNDELTAKCDLEHRRALSRNHSATHLLHRSLHELLSEKAVQKGSLVSAEKLRFDFSYDKPLSSEQLELLEQKVNEYILDNSTVQTEILSLDDAVKKGAMALFGEKYGDKVRLVSMGRQANKRDYSSKELCGGTHVVSTGEIGLFVITGQSSVASGVRRIEAITGKTAFNYLKERSKKLQELSLLLKCKEESISAKIEDLQLANKKLQKLQNHIVLNSSQNLYQVEEINSIKFCSAILDNINAKDLKSLADKARAECERAVIALISKLAPDKLMLVVGVTKNLTTEYNALAILNLANGILGGNGGGKADIAQAGGTKPEKAGEAIEAIRTYILSS